MTLADVPLVGSWVSTLVTVPLYLFIWKAGGTVKEIMQALNANTEAIKELTSKHAHHDGRLTQLEIEAAREEGRREGMPRNGHERTRKDD